MKPQGDPGAIRSAASTFGHASDALEREKAGLNQSVQGLAMDKGGGWISPASGAFKLSWAQDVPAFDQSARAMLDTSTALNDYATALEHALSEWKAAVSMTAGTGYTLNDDGTLTAPPLPHPTPDNPKPTIDPSATSAANRAQQRATNAVNDLQTAARTAGTRFMEIAARSKLVFEHPGGINHPEGEKGENPWVPSPVDLAIAALAISSDTTHGAGEALPGMAAALKNLAADHSALSSIMGKAASRHDWEMHSEAKALWNGIREAEKDLKDEQAVLRAVDESGLAGVLNTTVEIGGKAVRVVPLAAFALSVASDMGIDHNSAPEAVTREGLALGAGLGAGMGTVELLAMAGVAVPGVGEVILVAAVGGVVAYAVSKGVAVLWKKWGGSIDDAWNAAKHDISHWGGGAWHWITHPSDWF